MTSWHKTGAHPFYLGMYIHIYTHIYVHKYTSQKECLHIFWVRSTNESIQKLFVVWNKVSERGSTSLSARIAGEAKPSWLPSLCNTSQTAGPPIQTKQCKHQSSLTQNERNVSSCSDTDHHQSLTRSVIVHLVWPQRVRLWQEYWASLGNIQTESAGFSVLSFSSTPLPLATIMHSFCTGGCCHSINRNVHKNDASWRNWISVLGSLCGKKTTPISRVLAMHFKSTSRQVVLSQIERKIVHSGCACSCE